MLLLPVVLLLVMCLLLVVLFSMRNKRIYELTKHIPGPPTLPLLGNALEFLNDANFCMINRITSYLEQYDDIVPLWMGPTLMVFMSHPDDLQVFFTSHKVTDRGQSYKFIRDVLGPESIFTANGETWQKNRRLVGPAFHPSVIKAFPSSFVHHSNILIDVLRDQVGREINIAPFLRRLGYDLISKTSLDLDMASQKEECDVFENSLRLFDIISQRMWRAWLQPDIIFNSLGIGREQKTRVKKMNEFIYTIVKKQEMHYYKNLEEKKNDPEEAERKKSPFIYHMLKKGCTFQHIADQIATIAVTGYDTTAVTMSFTLMLLGMHPDIQERLYQEVVAVEEALEGREMMMEDLNEYRYMEMVLKEAMRIFPVGAILTRTCTEDVKFSKYTLPKGTEVAAVLYKTQRDERFFPDPLKFDPERFLPQNTIGRHPFCYAPFSQGLRNCIGIKYAMMLMKIVMSRILLSYKVHCRFKVPEVKVKVQVTSNVEGGFNITLEERSKGVVA